VKRTPEVSELWYSAIQASLRYSALLQWGFAIGGATTILIFSANDTPSFTQSQSVALAAFFAIVAIGAYSDGLAKRALANDVFTPEVRQLVAAFTSDNPSEEPGPSQTQGASRPPRSTLLTSRYAGSTGDSQIPTAMHRRDPTTELATRIIIVVFAFGGGLEVVIMPQLVWPKLNLWISLVEIAILQSAYVSWLFEGVAMKAELEAIARRWAGKKRAKTSSPIEREVWEKRVHQLVDRLSLFGFLHSPLEH